MIQGVIFDMDGVLADTEHFYQCRREDYLDRMDFPGPRGVDFVGSNERAIWETLVPSDAELREQMLQGYRAYRRFHPEDYSKLADPQVKPMFEELHLTPETAFAVEDSPTGIAAARNAGMTVYALRPRHSEKMDQSAANGILNSLAEVIEKL